MWAVAIGLAVRGLGFRVRGLGCLLARWLVIHANMAPPHTRACGWRHMTSQATFLACVIELGETGSSPFPPAVTGNHPNHFLLGFRAYALNFHTEQQTRQRGPRGSSGF